MILRKKNTTVSWYEKIHSMNVNELHVFLYSLIYGNSDFSKGCQYKYEHQRQTPNISVYSQLVQDCTLCPHGNNYDNCPVCRH
jgi:hypothetical protein